LRSRAVNYGYSIIILAVAVLIRWLLDPFLGDTLPLTPLGGAVAAAVWLGGYRPAILVMLVGYVVCSYLFISPRGQVYLGDVESVTGFAAYLFTCGLIIFIGEAMRRAQLRSAERGEILSVTLGSIGDAVITTDVRGRVNYLNAVAENLTGWSTSDAYGHPLDDVFRIVNESTRQPVESPAARALREGVIVGLANHTVLIRKDGRECPVDDSAAPIKNDSGEVSGCVLIFRDVSEKRRLEWQIAEKLAAARLLASIVESSEDPIISKTLDGTIRTWNAAAERLFGYSAEEAIGKNISLLIPEDRLAEEVNIISNLKAGRRIEHFETERVRKDGQLVPVSLTISPIRDDDGNVTGASKIARDITARKLADAERQKLVTLIESSTDFIGICDLEGIPFFINRAGLDLVGLDNVHEARNAPVREFFFPEDQDMIINQFFPAVFRDGHGEVEVRFRNFKTGEARWMAYKVIALKNESDQTVAFGTVSQDVTERRQLEHDLRRLANDLSEADRKKNEFLALLAHELRNPLAPIRNAVGILKSNADRDVIDSASQMLDRQVGQMTRLVDDLLDMSRITQGKIELRRERVELAPIVNQAVEAVRPFYRSMQQELIVSVPLEPICLNADAARLAQVIGNLLSNASKFTDPGGKIWLTAEQSDGHAVLSVKDTGIGIAPQNIPRLFELFTQVDTSLERSQGGLGIGLTLAKTLVEMTGGKIDVYSEGLGRGSEFVVRLPLETETTEIENTTNEASTPRQKAHRVLVVDDNADGAESMSLLLQLEGHESFVAHDAYEAIETAEKHRPEAIILDIGLPGMSGYEACRAIREKPWGRNLVLIAVTGWGQEEDRNRSKEAGFNAHIVKPVDHDALLKLLSQLLESANGRESNAEA
jgi:PAS domain S-box-containing protein